MRRRAGGFGAAECRVRRVPGAPGATSAPPRRPSGGGGGGVLEGFPELWRPSQAALATGFSRASLAGRFDCRGRWIFDVAHNPAGLGVLIEALGEAVPGRPVHALVGILADKAWPEMLAALGRVVDRVWLTTPPNAPPERRWDLVEVGRAVGQVGDLDTALPPDRLPARPPVIEPDFDRALREVQQGAGTVLVTGSFHTVGDAPRRPAGAPPPRPLLV